MKRFSCFSLSSVGMGIASLDIILSLSTLVFCSYYLYNDFSQMANWSQNEIKPLDPLSNFIATMVDYVLVNNFSNAFYMVLAVTLWIKSLINLVVASILMDGIRKQRLICIAPWLINTCVSMTIEGAIFIFMEIKIDEVDASMDRRIIRSIIYGVFTVLNALFTFGVFALYKMLKTTTNENRALQESIAETAGLFQHVKV
ncbi:uncharacterized protein LOC119677553 [Teleopsis dalmanni]|uniref:uncharacterized protein LOC119677553 n=1 Tax=Teleopsis dalmanni TaxID=139649 RepID=UPI0018CC963A|nr:uncharacterized protein LOC119677553 [Teleopsis dalmanni]